MPQMASGQDNAVVIVNADGKSGYGVSYSAPDRVVTALHVVAGRSSIQVKLRGATVGATIEKIYKDSDLALLKLKSPLPGLSPLPLYSGAPPLGINVEYWEFPPNAPVSIRRNTKLENETNLSKINPNVKPDPGLENSLCKDGGKTYPGMATEVIRFGEPNINHNHSGAPITYKGAIVGLVDGGGKLADGKPLVWAIHFKDIANLVKNGTPPPGSMTSCASGGASGKSMYSGIRSDNPNLSDEERQAAILFEEAAARPLIVHDNTGDTLSISKYQRMSFGELYETLFDENKQRIKDLFADEKEFSKSEQLSPEDLMEVTMDMDLGNKTGAWIVYPTGSAYVASKNAMGTVITIDNESALSTISFYLSKNNSPEEANIELAKFKEMLQALGQKTEPTTNNIKDFNCEAGNPYYREYIENADYDEQSDALLSKFTCSMTINKSDFLGVWLNVTDWKKMWNDREQRKLYYLLQSGIIFADFAIY
jgi:hypothetical protein